MKTILICSIFALSGFCFIGAGCYFLSEKYLKSLCETITDKNKQADRRALGKAAGYFSYAVGSLTIIFGIMFVLVPQIKYLIALIYMIFLSVAVCVLIGLFSKESK